MDDLSSSSRRQRRRRQRRHVQSDGEDYLSNLSDDLLRHILSFLPTPDSIRTSVLARRWRHVWTSVPVIDFSDLQLKSSIINRFIASRGGDGGDSVSHLHLTGFDIDRETHVYNLVKYAKSHGARHVTLLRFVFEQCSVSLFDLLFDWSSLLSLNLQFIGFKNSTLSQCIIFRLSNLKTLSLALPENTIRNEILARLLSSCPLLEELRLNAEYRYDELIQIEVSNLLRLTLIPTPLNLQINCQKLQYLRLKPDESLMYLHVEAPSLASVQLYSIWRFRTFTRTLCDVSAVTITVSDKCLSDTTPKFLGKYKTVVEGFPIFHKLLELKIKMFIAEKFSLDIVFDLLRCTPNLQSLVLTAYKKPPCDEDFEEWEKSSSRINAPLENLERISVNIKSERIRSEFLKILSKRVLAWDRVVVAY